MTITRAIFLILGAVCGVIALSVLVLYLVVTFAPSPRILYLLGRYEEASKLMAEIDPKEE